MVYVKPESLLEFETLKIFSDFEIQTVHLTRARIPDRGFINKKMNL